MFTNHTDHYRRLFFALLAMLLLGLGLGLGRPAKAADYTAGVDNINGAATLWLQGASVTQAIAHYNVAGGAQQNVGMGYNTTRARYELGVSASVGQSVNYQFTYFKAGLAYDSPWASSPVPGAASKVATPVFSLPSGSYSGPQQVSVSSTTSGATLQCAVNGAAPTACANPITVVATATITAIASKAGMANSDSASATYTIGSSDSGFSQGVVDSGTTLTVWFARSPKPDWVDIHTSLNGGAQQNVSMAYSGARHEVTLPVASGAAVSLAYSFTYMTSTGARDATGFSWTRGAAGGTVATPAITPGGGTFSAAQSVTLSTSTAGAVIRYTRDGSTPSAASTLYGGAFSVAAPGATVRAIALKSGMNNSAIAAAVFTITAGGGDTFTQGVAEDGATARVWFAPAWRPTTLIAHSYVTGRDGVQSAQRDENMSYDAAQKRWQASALSPLSTGAKISYMFTYSAPAGGNKDSAWYSYNICGDDAPDSPTCPSPVAKPVLSPAGGVYATQQSVNLALPAGSVADTKIYYTRDGSAPTLASSLFVAGSPILVASAMTINAIAVRPDLQQSRRASATYDIAPACSQTPAGCTVAAPTLSHASGSYATQIGVNMLTATPGATIHFTRDGTTPTRTSPQFNGAVWLAKSPEFGDTFTLKALATRDGKDSAVVSRTYTITNNAQSAWNGMTTFTVVNGTGGKYTDDKVFWVIIGKDWVTGQYVRADQGGKLVPVSEADNTIAIPGREKGYANYGVSLAQAKSVTIPAIESARIYMSVGKPVLVQINRDINGKTGYAGPDLENSSDPNLNTTFDFGEFNINRARPASDYPGIFVNTSRVDIFGFPLKLRVTGLDGYDATVGETLLETREQIFARFILETPAEFAGLAKAPYAPYRIMAPAHGTFNDGLNVTTGAQDKPRGDNAAYLDAYISDIWNKYRNENLVLKVGAWPTFTGRVGLDDVFTFSDGVDTYKIYGKPSTTEVMLGNGVLDDATGTTPNTPKHDKQLQLQAQLCAALNRHVAEQPSDRWYNADYFYPAGRPANFFTKFWHGHSFNGLAYGFSYDDVGGHSPSIFTPSPVSVTYTIGQ
ncbi:beta-1,3-glucanase family protein [Massilia sp. TWP1-3-3]|uniref:beta-1,3-glucanase family protein n=1 Tax=Massilia sp. TWP1-3-3 TaxID=2804573 RepID=UPI003CE716E5